MEISNNYFTKVQEFYTAADIPLGDLSRVKLRTDLFQEELDEFGVAWEKDDVVEMLDAIADMAYILAGTYIEFRQRLDAPRSTCSNTATLQEDWKKDKSVYFNCLLIFNKKFLSDTETNERIASLHDKCFAEVHASNMSKFYHRRKDDLQEDFVFDAMQAEAVRKGYDLVWNKEGTIAHLENGVKKLMKPLHYFRPNLKSIAMWYNIKGLKDVHSTKS